MVYYIIQSQVFTIFLSMAHMTSLTFPTKVNDYVGGEIGDFKIYELNKSKSLIFQPKKENFEKNFIAFSQGGNKYHFNLIYDDKNSQKDIVIKEAEPCSYFTLLKEVDSYQLFECPKSLYIVNKSKQPLFVNELTISSKGFVSKGPPVKINGKLVYFQGRLL